MLRQLRGFTSELSMASPKVALRLIIISTLFSVLCLLSSVTYAATQIMLEQGYEIRFDGGKIDTETFRMQITDVEVFKNDRRYWNADAILLDTILLADGQTLIVKNLKLTALSPRWTR